jgi:EAL domain-containing protein (putative c-di-GMP-specific phosphodiesterase class I)
MVMTRSRLDANYSGAERSQYDTVVEQNNTVSIAFQPIVNCIEQRIVGYEALVRGSNNENADIVMAKVTKQNRYSFDQLCRNKALEDASRLGLDLMLSINFLPNALANRRHCVESTLEVAQRYNFPTHNIIFEFTEVEKMRNAVNVANIIKTYKQLGFKTAIDDFGAGYSNLSLLADLQTDFVKLDMSLIRNIHQDHVRQTIVSHTIYLFKALGIQVIAEGIETQEEMSWLRSSGIELMQGYYFARPLTGLLPLVDFSLVTSH